MILRSREEVAEERTLTTVPTDSLQVVDRTRRSFLANLATVVTGLVFSLPERVKAFSLLGKNTTPAERISIDREVDPDLLSRVGIFLEKLDERMQGTPEYSSIITESVGSPDRYQYPRLVSRTDLYRFLCRESGRELSEAEFKDLWDTYWNQTGLGTIYPVSHSNNQTAEQGDRASDQKAPAENHYDQLPEKEEGEDSIDTNTTTSEAVTCLFPRKIGVLPGTGIFYYPIFFKNIASEPKETSVRWGLSTDGKTYYKNYHETYKIQIPAGSSEHPAVVEEPLVIDGKTANTIAEEVRAEKEKEKSPKISSRRQFLRQLLGGGSHKEGGKEILQESPGGKDLTALFPPDVFVLMEVTSFDEFGKKITKLYTAKLDMMSLLTDISRIPF